MIASRLEATRDNIDQENATREYPPRQTYILASNVLILLVLATITAIVILAMRPSAAVVAATLFEICALYVFVTLVQVAFLYTVAFQYVPPSKDRIFAHLAERLGIACTRPILFSPAAQSHPGSGRRATIP